MDMTAKEIINTWRWRIVKAGSNTKTFARDMGIAQSTMSEYFSGKKMPSIERFDEIQTRLKEMGV